VNDLTTDRRSTHPDPTGSPGDQLTGTAPTPHHRTWTVTTATGHTTSGYLPPWAEYDPSRTDVPVEQLETTLADVAHWAWFSGQSMRIATDDGPGTNTVILDGSIDCHPFAENPDARIPVVNLQIIDDYFINNLNPDGLAVIAAKLRAQAEYLDHEVRPALIAARTDWATHHRDRSAS
jgi:hypothetical protein